MSRDSREARQSNFTPVAWNRVWQEACKRERAHSSINETFQVNPRSVNSLTSKPNTRPARFLDKDAYLLGQLRQRGVLSSDMASLLDSEEPSTSTPPPAADPTPAQSESSRAATHERDIQMLRDTLHRVPAERYREPMTSSQEVGWFNERIIQSRDSRFHFPLTQCDETKYAAKVYELGGDMRSRRGGGGGGGKPS